ncbi:MAG: DUF6502 family protein [Bdellovibrionota bacterium]|nr:MAG: DUF6502 family protein [Bdellovibrionota bacterium]
MEKSRSELARALRILMRPIARFCARHSFHIQDLIEAAKAAFLDVAEEELSQSTDKVSVCKLATFTGLHRRDVDRIFKREEIRESGQGLISRVIGQWQQSRRFCGKSGKPRVLRIDQAKDEFKALVESVTTEVTPGTILFELERIGAVEHTRDGLKLASRVYLPHGDIKEGFRIAQSDIDDLLHCIEGNLLGDNERSKNLHLRTYYDRIPVAHTEEIRQWITREGSALHQKARNFISRFDLDLNPRRHDTGAVTRITLGTFSYCPAVEEPAEERATSKRSARER